MSLGVNSTAQLAGGDISATDVGMSLRFKREGSAVRYCTAGWSQPEDDETWCLGSSSTVVLPPIRRAVPHVLVLEMRSNLGEIVGVLSQQITICVNDVTIGSFVVTSPALTVRACIIPSEVLAAGGPVTIVFKTPDAAHGPAGDDRVLDFAFRSLQLFPDKLALGTSTSPVDAPVMSCGQIPVAELMLKFESLGQNCEFGFVQRSCHAEPNDLLRFASAPLPSLLAALQASFNGMGDPESLQVKLSNDGHEFII
jgi:hypothetical protein